ncbi:MAG: hypothetical protein IPK79_11105 [Vampirovibrionales bacterium]|nr:hypothetical protein [Vampirovibrionales bacterium]
MTPEEVLRTPGASLSGDMTIDGRTYWVDSNTFPEHPYLGVLHSFRVSPRHSSGLAQEILEVEDRFCILCTLNPRGEVITKNVNISPLLPFRHEALKALIAQTPDAIPLGHWLMRLLIAHVLPRWAGEGYIKA